MSVQSKEGHESTECAGRFRLVIPADFKISGRSQSIYRVDISTVPIPAGGFKAFWDARLARVRPPGSSRDTGQLNFTTLELLPGVPAVWYVGNPAAPQIRNLEAAKLVGDFAALAARSGEAGKESSVELLVRTVLDAYVPATNSGFCVGNGSITSEPGLNEHALLSLEHKNTQNFEFRLETRTVSSPDTQTYSDVEEEKELVHSGGGKLSVLRDDARTVAGLEGKEIAISVAPGAEAPFLRFTWHFAGVSDSSAKPAINIVGSAPVSHQAELQKTWDALLQSVQSVPLATQHPK